MKCTVFTICKCTVCFIQCIHMAVPPSALRTFSPSSSPWLFRLGEGQGHLGEGPELEDHGRRQVARPGLGFLSASLWEQDSRKCRHSHVRIIPGGRNKGSIYLQRWGLAWAKSWARNEGLSSPRDWKGGEEGEFQRPRREDVATATLRREVPPSAEGNSQS